MISAPNFPVLGSACVSRAGDGVFAVANFSWPVASTFECASWNAAVEKFVAAERRNQHAGRMRYPIRKSLRI